MYVALFSTLIIVIVIEPGTFEDKIRCHHFCHHKQ